MANRVCESCNGKAQLPFNPPMEKGADRSCPACGGRRYKDDPTYVNVVRSRYVSTTELQPGDEILTTSGGVFYLTAVAPEGKYIRVQGFALNNWANVETEISTTIPGENWKMLLISRKGEAR